MAKKKKLCYVIMPFSSYVGIPEEEWTEIYENIFKPAIEGSGFGYRCERSEITAGAFTKEIVQNMKNAYLVLSDITGFNGNVMWELGVRHSLSPRTIMVARDKILDTKIISDLKIYGVISYDNNAGAIKQFKTKIKKSLKKIDDEPERADNPVFDFLKIEDLVLTSYDRKQIVNRLKGLLSELIENLRIVEGMMDDTYHVKTNSVTSYRFHFPAIEYYLVTNYVNVSDVFTEELHTTLNWLKDANVWLEILNNRMNDPSVKDEDKKPAVTQILNCCEKLKGFLKLRITEIKKCLELIQKDEFTYTESSVFYHKSEHKSLLN